VAQRTAGLKDGGHVQHQDHRHHLDLDGRHGGRLALSLAGDFAFLAPVLAPA
jgi:hypothetical protein